MLGVKVEDGAVLQAQSDTFTNCQVSIEFTPYEYTSTWQNRGKFENCDFVWKNILPGYNGDSLIFVKLTGVKGISFRGCFFENRIVTQLADIKACGIGIKSVDAGYRLSKAGPYSQNLPSNPCDDGAIGRRSRFEGLYMGINHNAIHSKYMLEVRYTDFYNFLGTAIYTMGEYHTWINSCKFQINSAFKKPISPSLSEIMSKGIEFIASSGFFVDANIFDHDTTVTLSYWMINVSNSGSGGGDIYRNTFETRHYGILVVPVIPSYHNPKLQIQCNNFTGFSNDILYLGSSGQRPHLFPDQGSLMLDAGNIFSGCAGASRNIDYSKNLYYYSDTSIAAKIPSCSPNVTVIPVPSANVNPCSPQCPSFFTAEPQP